MLALAFALVPVCGAATVGCNLSREAHAAEAAPAEPAVVAPKAEKSEHPEEKGEKQKFGVPFVPEDGADLRNAHSFLRTLTRDNERFVKATGSKHFIPFIEKQKPRATVVTCSDSRVQSTAFDADPENDVFTIRNIGNQLVNADGSVRYGVEHLKTPVLFIMGHTGCGAIKAAMGDISKQHASIKKELETLHTEKKTNPEDTKVWLDAVLANVNDQVVAALERYPEEVAQGRLIVIGSVYDLRNDLKDGYGKVHIVNVNGQTDAKKLKAFSRAIAREMPALDDPETMDKEGKEGRDAKEIRDIKDVREGKETKEELRDGKESRERLRETLGASKDGRGPKEDKKDTKESTSDRRERREAPAEAVRKESKH